MIFLKARQNMNYKCILTIYDCDDSILSSEKRTSHIQNTNAKTRDLPLIWNISVMFYWPETLRIKISKLIAIYPRTAISYTR